MRVSVMNPRRFFAPFLVFFSHSNDNDNFMVLSKILHNYRFKEYSKVVYILHIIELM